MQITELEGLSNRAKNVLQRNGIMTAEKLISTSEETIAGFYNTGVKTLEEVVRIKKQLIAERGLGVKPSASERYSEAVATYGGYTRGGTFFFIESGVYAPNAKTTSVLRTETLFVEQLANAGVSTMDELLEMSTRNALQVLKDSEPLCRAIIVDRSIYFPKGYEPIVDVANTLVDVLAETGEVESKFSAKSGLAVALSKKCQQANYQQTDTPDEATLMKILVDALSWETCRNLVMRVVTKRLHFDSMEALRDSISERLPVSLVGAIVDTVPDVVVDEHGVRYEPPTALAYFNSLPDSMGKSIMLERLGGKPLHAIAREVHMSYTRVREIAVAVMEKKPMLMEDVMYGDIFQTYHITPTEFRAIFVDEPEYVPNYIFAAYKQGRKTLRDLLLSGELDTDSRERLGQLLLQKERTVTIDGERVKRTLQAVIEYVLKTRYKGEPVDIDELMCTVRAVVAGNGLNISTRMEKNGWYNAMEYVPTIVKHSQTKVRYVHVSYVDAQNIIKRLPIRGFMGKRVSTEMLWKKMKPTMKRLDIRNGNELHSILKHHRAMMPCYVVFLHNPVLDIGDVDFQKQVIEVATRMNATSHIDVMRELEREYGFNLNSMRASNEIKAAFSEYERMRSQSASAV